MPNAPRLASPTPDAAPAAPQSHTRDADRTTIPEDTHPTLPSPAPAELEPYTEGAAPKEATVEVSTPLGRLRLHPDVCAAQTEPPPSEITAPRRERATVLPPSGSKGESPLAEGAFATLRVVWRALGKGGCHRARRAHRRTTRVSAPSALSTSCSTSSTSSSTPSRAASAVGSR
jgi:hypothetical protein